MAQQGEKNLFLLILYSFTIISHSSSSQHNSIFRAGAILTKTNRAYIASSRWLLVTELYFSHLAEHLRNLNELAHYTAIEQETIYKKFAFAPDLANRIARHSRSRTASIARQMTSMSTAVNQAIISMRLPPSPHRRRRALLDIGGTLLKKLFGTATTNDVDRLHRLLVSQEKQHATLFHLQHYQITLFNKTNTLFRSVFQRSAELTSQLRFLQTDIKAAVANFSTLLDRSFLTNKLSNTHLFMDNLLRDTRYFRDFFLRTLDVMLHKRLSTELLPPDQLYNALVGISKHLPSSLSVLPDLDAALLNIYKTSKLSVDFISTTAYIKIAVPLLNRQHILDVYHISFIPHHFREHQLSLFAPQQDTNLLATSDRTYFITLTDSELARTCPPSGNQLYCSLKRPLHSLVTKSCELDLLLHEHIPQTCNFSLNATHSPLFSYISDHQWAYSVPQKTIATISCRGHTDIQTTTHTLTHTGVITLPPFCSLFTNTTHILPSGTITSKAEPLRFRFYSPAIDEARTNFSFYHFLRTNFPTLNATQPFADAITAHTTFKPLPLDKLTELYNTLKPLNAPDLQDDSFTQSLLPHIPYPILFLATFVGLLLLYRRLPQPTKPKNNTEQGTSTELLSTYTRQ